MVRNILNKDDNAHLALGHTSIQAVANLKVNCLVLIHTVMGQDESGDGLRREGKMKYTPFLKSFGL